MNDSLLEAKETLELLNKTLRLSGGKLGKFHDTRGFVASVCELGKGNELIALQCLKRAAADEELRMPWASYQDQLREFLESLIDAPKDIRDKAIEVADTYGRLHPEKFREVWNKLKVQH